MKKIKIGAVMVSALVVASQVYAQQRTDPPTAQALKQPAYILTVDVVDRTTKTINYKSRSGSTKVDFRGTPLLPMAEGEAKVESKKGYMEVEVQFNDLVPATRFGPEYLTYVLWAITPEGRPTNMGEVILDGTKGKLDVTTELQAFGMVVTAEPYFAVAQPSDVVIMENIVREDTVGKVGEIVARYQLLKRGQYIFNALPADLKPMDSDKNTPLELYEARNAVRIARWARAATFATGSFNRASSLLAQAEKYQVEKASSKLITMTAREAVQTAEDSRLLTMTSQAEARLAQERAASANREAAANADAADARADTRDAERNRALAQAQSELRLAQERAASTARERTANAAAADARTAASDAERNRGIAQAQATARLAQEQTASAQREAAASAAAAAAARTAANDAERRRAAVQAEADARLMQEKTASAEREALSNAAAAAAAKTAAENADRTRALQIEESNRTRLDAERASQRAADDAKAQAERARLDVVSANQRAARDKEATEAANRQATKSAAERSEREKQELRRQLTVQLNSILETKDSARGLIVNMSDVLFDTGQFSLKPGARERLAKVSGIVLAYPTLTLQVEGHTDSVGTDDENQRLSENRANSVRDFLISQGIITSSISSRGFGETLPVATNDSAAGRQLNRRVDLVVSGEAIGNADDTAVATKAQK